MWGGRDLKSALFSWCHFHQHFISKTLYLYTLKSQIMTMKSLDYGVVVIF